MFQGGGLVPKRGRYEHTNTMVALNKDPANVDSSEIESGGEEELDVIRAARMA